MTTETKIGSDLEKIHPLHHIIRMRNIQQHIKTEYGLEIVRLFWQWEKIGMQDGRFQKTIQDFHLDALVLTLYQ